MPRVYVGVGSNLGPRERNVECGLRLLSDRGFRIVRFSPVYETDPVSMPGARKFLNLVIAAETEKSPEACLADLLRIEREVGRPAHVRNQPRTLDLDLLFYGGKVINRPGLIVPHPRLHERAFVLAPLADIAPALIHPVLHRRIATLRSGLDETGVRRFVRMAPRPGQKPRKRWANRDCFVRRRLPMTEAGV